MPPIHSLFSNFSKRLPSLRPGSAKSLDKDSTISPSGHHIQQGQTPHSTKTRNPLSSGYTYLKGKFQSLSAKKNIQHAPKPPVTEEQFPAWKRGTVPQAAPGKHEASVFSNRIRSFENKKHPEHTRFSALNLPADFFDHFTPEGAEKLNNLSTRPKTLIRFLEFMKDHGGLPQSSVAQSNAGLTELTKAYNTQHMDELWTAFKAEKPPAKVQFGSPSASEPRSPTNAEALQTFVRSLKNDKAEAYWESLGPRAKERVFQELISTKALTLHDDGGLKAVNPDQDAEKLAEAFVRLAKKHQNEKSFKHSPGSPKDLQRQAAKKEAVKAEYQRLDEFLKPLENAQPSEIPAFLKRYQAMQDTAALQPLFSAHPKEKFPLTGIESEFLRLSNTITSERKQAGKLFYELHTLTNQRPSEDAIKGFQEAVEKLEKNLQQFEAFTQNSVLLKNWANSDTQEAYEDLKAPYNALTAWVPDFRKKIESAPKDFITPGIFETNRSARQKALPLLTQAETILNNYTELNKTLDLLNKNKILEKMSSLPAYKQQIEEYKSFLKELQNN